MTVAQKNAQIAKGILINEKISESHKYGDEFALLRKEINHIEEVLNITPTEEFSDYYAEAEAIKADVKRRLNLVEENSEDE